MFSVGLSPLEPFGNQCFCSPKVKVLEWLKYKIINHTSSICCSNPGRSSTPADLLPMPKSLLNFLPSFLLILDSNLRKPVCRINVSSSNWKIILTANLQHWWPKASESQQPKVNLAASSMLSNYNLLLTNDFSKLKADVKWFLLNDFPPYMILYSS